MLDFLLLHMSADYTHLINRFVRMEADKDAFLDKLFGNRHEEHEGRVAEFEKHLAEVRAERLEERKKKRVAERRQTYINQLREQKKKEREEQQRREKVWN